MKIIAELNKDWEKCCIGDLLPVQYFFMHIKPLVWRFSYILLYNIPDIIHGCFHYKDVWESDTDDKSCPFSSL